MERYIINVLIVLLIVIFGHNSDLKGQLDDTKMRLHQYEKKKRKRKPSQLLQHHDYQNGPIISPTTDSESVPVRSPFQPATCRATVSVSVCIVFVYYVRM